MVVVLNERLDALDELGDVLEGAAANGFLGDQSKPAFDLVDP
jgi:hypothetical protein